MVLMKFTSFWGDPLLSGKEGDERPGSCHRIDGMECRQDDTEPHNFVSASRSSMENGMEWKEEGACTLGKRLFVTETKRD